MPLELDTVSVGQTGIRAHGISQPTLVRGSILGRNPFNQGAGSRITACVTRSSINNDANWACVCALAAAASGVILDILVALVLGVARRGVVADFKDISILRVARVITGPASLAAIHTAVAKDIDLLNVEHACGAGSTT
jgi:hypothetical protein